MSGIGGFIEYTKLTDNFGWDFQELSKEYHACLDKITMNNVGVKQIKIDEDHVVGTAVCNLPSLENVVGGCDRNNL